MTTRQEMQTGHDLIHFTNGINQSLFALSHQLQGKIEVKIATSWDTTKDPTADELKTIITDGLKNVNQKYSIWIESFLSVAPVNLPDNGLDYYGVLKSVLDADILQDKDIRLNFASSVASADTIEKLKTVGENLEASFNFTLGSNFLTVPQTVKIPEVERMANICNDCLDTASYELRNIQPSTGKSMTWTVDEIKARVPDRFKVVGFRGSGSMLTVANQAKVDLPLANSYQDLIDIADYIDANVSKLPLVRRAWGV